MPKPLKRLVAVSRGRSAQAASQRESCRNHIIQASTSLFSRNGYLSTTMEDVAREANVSRATLYRYFNNRLEIGNAVVEHSWASKTIIWGSLTAEDATSVTAVASWINRLVNEAATNGLSRVIIEMSLSETEFLHKSHTYKIGLVRLLAQEIEAFARALTDPVLLARAYLLIDNLTMQIVTMAQGFAAFPNDLIIAHSAADFVRFVESEHDRDQQ